MEREGRHNPSQVLMETLTLTPPPTKRGRSATQLCTFTTFLSRSRTCQRFSCQPTSTRNSVGSLTDQQGCGQALPKALENRRPDRELEICHDFRISVDGFPDQSTGGSRTGKNRSCLIKASQYLFRSNGTQNPPKKSGGPGVFPGPKGVSRTRVSQGCERSLVQLLPCWGLEQGKLPGCDRCTLNTPEDAPERQHQRLPSVLIVS